MFKAKKIIVVLLAVCLLIPLGALSVSADNINNYNVPLSSVFTSGTIINKWVTGVGGATYSPSSTDSGGIDGVYVNNYVLSFTSTNRTNIWVEAPIYSIEVPNGYHMKITFSLYLFNFGGVYPTQSYFSMKNTSSGDSFTLYSSSVPKNKSPYIDLIFDYENDTGKSITLDFLSFGLIFDSVELYNNKAFLFGVGTDGINIEVYQSALDEEKTEAEKGGNSGVNDLANAIPGDTGGLISSFGRLTSNMLHTNTRCVISFPAIKTPAIAGVIPSYTLSEAKEIDFEKTVEMIPSSIMSIVRALMTIALILFCFKELYSTISYVLTLKGGGDG